MTGSARHDQVLELVEWRHCATEAASSALAAVINAIAVLPASDGNNGASGRGGSVGGGLGVAGGRARDRDRRYTLSSTLGHASARSVTSAAGDARASGLMNGGLRRYGSARNSVLSPLSPVVGLHTRDEARPVDDRQILKDFGVASFATIPTAGFANGTPRVRTSSATSGTAAATAAAGANVGLSSVVQGAHDWKQRVAGVAEERRVKSRAAAMGAAGAESAKPVAAAPGTALSHGGERETRNRKLSPEEVRAASRSHYSLQSVHARAASPIDRRIRLDDARRSNQEQYVSGVMPTAQGVARASSTASAARLARAARAVAVASGPTRRLNHASSPLSLRSAAREEGGNGNADSGAGMACFGRRERVMVTGARERRQQRLQQQQQQEVATIDDIKVAEAAQEEELARVTRSDAALAVLLSATSSPSREAQRARRRARRHSLGDERVGSRSRVGDDVVSSGPGLGPWREGQIFRAAMGGESREERPDVGRRSGSEMSVSPDIDEDEVRQKLTTV